MKIKVAQLIFFSEDNTYITLVGVKWKDANSGELTIYGCPARLKRIEHFDIEDKEVITNSFHFPIGYLIKWMQENDAIDEKGILTDIEL